MTRPPFSFPPKISRLVDSELPSSLLSSSAESTESSRFSPLPLFSSSLTYVRTFERVKQLDRPPHRQDADRLTQGEAKGDLRREEGRERGWLSIPVDVRTGNASLVSPFLSFEWCVWVASSHSLSSPEK